MHRNAQLNNEEIWKTFCSKNEYRAKYKDKHDRFPHFLSSNDPLKANVSEYLVKEGLKIKYPEIFIGGFVQK